MASEGSDQDARYALSKLLQRGTVAEYEREAFSLACIIEARFEAIVHEEKATVEKEQSIKGTTDTITSLQSEVASLKVKGSIDAKKEIKNDHTLVHELEKQEEKLSMELQLKNNFRETLESTSKDLEKTMLDPNQTLHDL
nr:myosin heavy chain-related protein [Tanacetum cinerariifolium]